MSEIMRHRSMETPTLVIDEQIKSLGRVPEKEEIMEWMDVD
jgi:hypothetical protein